MKKKPKLVIKPGAQDDTWGTPEWILDIVRNTHGAITHDLASSPTANKLVRARRYFCLVRPCPKEPLGLVEAQHAVVWCNPPGGVEKVRWFWERWLWCIHKGASGAFLIFNLDHWRALGSPASYGVQTLHVGLPKGRLKFVGAPFQYNHPSGLVSSSRLIDFDGNQMLWL